MNTCAFVSILLFLPQILPSNSLILIKDAPRKVVKTLRVSNGAPWGTWGVSQFCAEGTYAIGYTVKVCIIS